MFSMDEISEERDGARATVKYCQCRSKHDEYHVKKWHLQGPEVRVQTPALRSEKFNTGCSDYRRSTQKILMKYT
ncbi:hypothetical protein TNCV_3768751 [Trichonephila clavipes]|nr:hypothetical protein TNCV_3768751 [Trichonephila clavipes]